MGCIPKWRNPLWENTTVNNQFVTAGQYMSSEVSAGSGARRFTLSDDFLIATLRVSRREMYCGHARLCVCVSACLFVCVSARGCMPTLLHGPGLTWESGRGCPLVVHCWADLQSVHGLRCYGNTRNAWQNPAVIRQAHRTPHALRMSAKTPLASDKIDVPAACATVSATRPFHFVHISGCCNANAKC